MKLIEDIFVATVMGGLFLFFGVAIWKMLGSIGKYKYEKGGLA